MCDGHTKCRRKVSFALIGPLGKRNSSPRRGRLDGLHYTSALHGAGKSGSVSWYGGNHLSEFALNSSPWAQETSLQTLKLEISLSKAKAANRMTAHLRRNVRRFVDPNRVGANVDHVIELQLRSMAY